MVVVAAAVVVVLVAVVVIVIQNEKNLFAYRMATRMCTLTHIYVF